MDSRSGRIRVFLCHSIADKGSIRALYRRLEADGFAPWLDEVDLIPGQDWELAIKDAVRAVDFVLVCLSNAATTRAGYVQKEIKLALDVADQQPEGRIFLIPVRLEECMVPDRLSRWQCVDLLRRRQGLHAPGAGPREGSQSASDASDTTRQSSRSASTTIWSDDDRSGGGYGREHPHGSEMERPEHRRPRAIPHASCRA